MRRKTLIVNREGLLRSKIDSPAVHVSRFTIHGHWS
jgi:hypothetical protein